MAPEALTFVEGADATIPATTSVVVENTNQGKAPVVFLGYEDGSGDVQLLGDVDGIPVQGTTTLEGTTSDAATTTTVNDTASSTQLLAANATRVGWTITNTSSAVLYVKFGTTASATSFAKRLTQNGDCGQTNGLGIYRGRIDGIWASDPGDGVAVITEW